MFLCVRVYASPTATANNFSGFFFVGRTLKTSIKKWKFNKLVFCTSVSRSGRTKSSRSQTVTQLWPRHTTSNSTYTLFIAQLFLIYLKLTKILIFNSSFVVRKIVPEFILRSCGSTVPISIFVSMTSELFLAFDVYSVCVSYTET